MGQEDRHEHLEELNRRLEAAIGQRTRELERQNRDLAETNHRMQQADRRKSEFLANISHELRTPMHSILGYTNMLLKGSYGYLNDQQRRNLKKVYENAQHLLHILNDLLGLSHLELGRLKLRIAPVSVKKIVLSSLVSVEPLLVDRVLALEHEIPPDLPPVLADEVRTKEVLINLLSNAVKFTPDGGRIDIVARVPVSSGGGDARVELQVRDTGIGIEKENQEVIFDQFRQLNEHKRPEERGSGLGLFISRKLIEVQHGTLRVESEPGRGSTFSVTLPAVPASSPEGPEEPAGEAAPEIG